MYAVVKTGGKQYRVAVGDVLRVEKIEAEAGATLNLDQVLLIESDGKLTVGAPLVAGAVVKAEVIEQDKNRTIIVFKKNRRHNYRRRNGHRQKVTVIKITEINA